MKQRKCWLSRRQGYGMRQKGGQEEGIFLKNECESLPFYYAQKKKQADRGKKMCEGVNKVDTFSLFQAAINKQ